MKINTTPPQKTLFACLLSLIAISNSLGSVVTTSTSTVVPSRFWLDFKSETNAASQMAVAYLPQCTLGVDFGYDAAKFAEVNVMTIYSLIDNLPFTIQARPSFTQEDVVPIGIQTVTAGIHSISLNHCDGVFAQGQDIFVLDVVTGNIINLHERPIIADLDAGTYNDRFVMGYSYDILQTLTTKKALATQLTVFTTNNVIAVESGTPIQSILIYDISGKLLYNSSGLQRQNIAINGEAWKSQPIVLQIYTENKRTTKKIVY
ncbi:MAG: hypothetical protein ACOVRN_08310 [Flavobacterium sp.]